MERGTYSVTSINRHLGETISSKGEERQYYYQVFSTALLVNNRTLYDKLAHVVTYSGERN